MSNLTFNFFSLNKLEILLLLTFHLTICRTESQKNRKTKSKQQVYWHSLPKFALGYFSVFQFAAYSPVLKGKGGFFWFSKLNSLTKDTYAMGIPKMNIQASCTGRVQSPAHNTEPLHWISCHIKAHTNTTSGKTF